MHSHYHTVTLTPSPAQDDSLTSPEGHVISGPLGGGARKRRQHTSPLAQAFQNAWKQGTLASDVSCDHTVINVHIM